MQVALYKDCGLPCLCGARISQSQTYVLLICELHARQICKGHHCAFHSFPKTSYVFFSQSPWIIFIKEKNLQCLKIFNMEKKKKYLENISFASSIKRRWHFPNYKETRNQIACKYSIIVEDLRICFSYSHFGLYCSDGECHQEL